MGKSKFIRMTIALYIITGLVFLLPAQTGSSELKILVANESYDEAMTKFRELLKHDSEDAELYYLGAFLQKRLMRQDSSLIYLKKAAEIDPDNEKILLALANDYTDLRRFPKAIGIYRDLIAKDSLKLTPHIQLAGLYMKISQFRGALEIYNYLHEREPDNASFLKSIGSCHMRLGNDLRALSYYKMAHQINPQDLSINLSLAGLYLKMKNYKDGLEIAERGLEVERQSAELLYWSGLFNYLQGLHYQAITRFEVAEKNGNESVQLVQYLGICYYRTENYEKARDYLEKAILVNVNSFVLFNFLGNIYRELNDLEISELYFNNALAALAPPVDELTNTYLNLVETYILAGEYQKAVEAYIGALDYDKKNPYLYYGLAYTLDNYLNKPSEALEHYMMFSELAAVIIESDNDMPSLIDYSNSRIKKIKEDIFFGQE
jgi:tetratricopeptide (TPR) repeat protein